MCQYACRARRFEVVVGEVSAEDCSVVAAEEIDAVLPTHGGGI